MSRVRVMVAFSDETVEWLDDMLDEFEFRSRSHLIDAAVQRYLQELQEELDEEDRDAKQDKG